MSDREIYLECEHHKAEQLKSDIKYLNNVIKVLQQENKQLKEVIEEVREYIKAETKREAFHHYLSDEDLDKLLQILDKGELK